MRLLNLLTPWSRVLLEKLTGSAASQEIPRIFGTRRFITVLTSVRHLSLSWANSIQSSQPCPISWRSILILSSQLHDKSDTRIPKSAVSNPSRKDFFTFTGFYSLKDDGWNTGLNLIVRRYFMQRLLITAAKVVILRYIYYSVIGKQRKLRY